MAGAGKRFSDSGYSFPKPMIDIKGKPTIQVVVENLNMDANYIYLVQKEHNERYNTSTMLNLLTPKLQSFGGGRNHRGSSLYSTNC